MSAPLFALVAGMTAVLGAFAGGAVWHTRAIGRAYAAGVVAGRTALQSEVEAQATAQMRASEVVLAAARARIPAMGKRHEDNQEKLDALEDDTFVEGFGTGQRLSPGLVRKLDAVGRDPGDTGPGA
ncbi:MAG: hypothetical protein JWL62_872 [Hyphomicrobiales bacterium]|nr:hypothetical protein [Hyphomicrobiales bacterium]